MNTVIQNVEVIAKNNLCISCGTCSTVCPRNNVKIIYSNIYGKWVPHIINQELCKHCNGSQNCLFVCHSYKTNYLDDKNVTNPLGIINEIYTGFSCSPETRFSRSSGGFLAELCKSLLSSGDINGIITLKHTDGLDYEPDVYTDIKGMPCSVYHNVNFQMASKILVEREGKFLIIGLPCHISSIYKMTCLSRYSHLKNKIYAKVALTCGYTFDRNNLGLFIKSSGFNENDLEEITYRGDGRYRRTVIKYKNSTSSFNAKISNTLKDVLNYRFITDRMLVQYGCLCCVDHLGYFADIVAGDAWLDRFNNDICGSSIVIARTIKAQEIIKKVKGFKFSASSNSDIIESQCELYAYGSLSEAIKEERKKKGLYVPEHIRIIFERQKYKLSINDRIKVQFIKKLIDNKKYKRAKIVYFLTNISDILKTWIKNKIRIKRI